MSRCRECAGRRLAFASARAAVAYAGPVRPLVVAWKEHGLRQACHLAAELVAGSVPRPSADAIAHVPPDLDRAVRRGRHPAEQLARALAERWELEPASVLRRRPDGSRTRQKGLSRERRSLNVRDAFVADASPSRVVLIDDVYTTGATATAAATALRRAGATRVDVVTFARVVRG